MFKLFCYGFYFQIKNVRLFFFSLLQCPVIVKAHVIVIDAFNYLWGAKNTGTSYSDQLFLGYFLFVYFTGQRRTAPLESNK